MSSTTKSQKAVAGGRVKKIIIKEGGFSYEFFVVESRDRVKYYVVIPGRYCSCPDFLFSVLLKKEKKYCYHLRAVDIALRNKSYGVKVVDNEEEKNKVYLKLIAGFIL